MTPDEMTKQNGIFHEKLRHAGELEVIACVDVPGARHDLRLYTYNWHGKCHTSLVCIWCAGVACGDPTQLDPCLEIYHHRGDHRSASGESWPIGGSRQEPRERC